MTGKQNQAETLFFDGRNKNKKTLLVRSLTLRLANLFLPPRARQRIWSRSDKFAAYGFLLLSLCSPQLLKPSGAGRHYQVGPGEKKKKKRILPPFLVCLEDSQAPWLQPEAADMA